MNEQSELPPHFHFYLVVGNVIISDGVGDKVNVQAIPQNAMMRTDTVNLGVHQLGKAQQALQITLFKKLNGTVNVVDVILTNLVYLGFMTEELFQARPDGVVAQEVAKPTADVIDFTKGLTGRE